MLAVCFECVGYGSWHLYSRLLHSTKLSRDLLERSRRPYRFHWYGCPQKVFRLLRFIVFVPNFGVLLRWILSEYRHTSSLHSETHALVMSPGICVLTLYIQQGRKSLPHVSGPQSRHQRIPVDKVVYPRWMKRSLLAGVTGQISFASLLTIANAILRTSPRGLFVVLAPLGDEELYPWSSPTISSRLLLRSSWMPVVVGLPGPELCNRPWPPSWGSRRDGNVASSLCASLLPAQGHNCSPSVMVPWNHFQAMRPTVSRRGRQSPRYREYARYWWKYQRHRGSAGTHGVDSQAGTPPQGRTNPNWRATDPSTSGLQPHNWSGRPLFLTFSVSSSSGKSGPSWCSRSQAGVCQVYPTWS